MFNSGSSWRIPKLGCVSEEPVPKWILDAWCSKVISLNSFGGFTKSTKDGNYFGYPGDIAVLDNDYQIQFYPTEATKTESI